MRHSGWLRSAAFGLLAVAAVLRALVAMAPDPFFSIDPRILVVPLEGLGPAGSAVLDTLSLLGCLSALAAEFVDGRRVDVRLLLLFLVPIPILGWHGWNDAEQLRIGSQWIAAVATAVGAAHLARDARWRILLLGAAVALTIPLAIKGLYQVTIEYGDTLQSFEQNKSALLESQGWEAGSSAAEIYFRRLTQREATGWFALSNVYGSVLAMLGTLWVGASLAVARSRLQSGWLGVTVIVAGMGLAGLTASFSKGAAAAAVVGLVLAAMCLLPRRWKQHVRPHTAALTAALIVTALVVTALRGALFPESLQRLDGFSLLFRWHYWVGAARALADHPFVGVGPGGFQSAYLLYRPLLSPEEVASPHSVFVDWLAGGGVVMTSWLVLVITLLWRAAPAGAGGTTSASGVREHSESSTDAGDADPLGSPPRALSPRLVWSHGLALALLAGGAGWFLNRRVLFIDSHLLLMPLSLAGMALTVGLVSFLIRHVSLGLLRWAVWAALTVALLHSQIEMTLTQPGSGAVIMLLLGTAATRVMRDSREQSAASSRSSLVGVVAVAAVVVTHVLLVATPIVRIERHLHAAHTDLESVGSLRATLAQARGARTFQERLGYLRDAETQLEQAGVSIQLEGTWREIQSAVQLNDPERVQRLVATGGAMLDEAMQRLEISKVSEALLKLDQARQLTPLQPIAWRESSKLWMHLARQHDSRGDAANCEEAAGVAISLAEELARRRPGDVNAAALSARRWYERNQLMPAPESLSRAIEWQERVVALDPNGLEAQRTLARMLDEAGRRAAALEAYERTLQINENMRLDPLKQLGESQLAGVRARIAALGGG